MPRIPDEFDLIRVPRSALRVVPVTPRDSGLAEFGESLGRVVQARKEREDRFNYARAQSAFLQKQDEVLNGLQDDDYATYEARYQEGVKQALAETQGMIRSRLDREAFEIESQRYVMRGLESARSRAKAKETDFGRSSLDETLAANRQSALTATDQVTRNEIIRAGVDAIEGARERGYVDAEAATNIRQSWIQDVAKSSLEIMEPAERLQNLDSVGFLPEDVKVGIRRGAERELKALEREREAEAERERVRLRRVLTGQVEDATAAYMQGLQYDSPPTESDFLAAYGEEGTERYQAFQSVQELGEDIGALAKATPAERDALLASREPEVGPGFAAATGRFSALVKAAQALEKAKQSDPVAYIAEQFGEIEDREELLAEQERLGVEVPRLMTNAQVREVAKRFTETEDGTAAAVIEELESEYGNHWPTVFRQLAEAGIPGEALVIGAGVPSDVAETLSRLAPLKTDELKAGLPRTASTDVNESLSDIMQPFQQTLALQGGQRTFATFYTQAERLAYHYMAQGLNSEDASNRAYRELVAQKYVFQDTYRIPVDFDAGRVADGAEKAIEALDVGVLPDLGAASVSREILDQAYWVTNGDETGLVLHYNGAALPSKNGLIEMSFQDLEAQGSGWMERLSRLGKRLTPDQVLFPLPRALMQ